jgi:chromosome segregation ATPase
VSDDIDKQEDKTDYKAMVEGLKAETDAMRNKMAELLNETKTAKQKAKEEAEAAAKLAEENARKSGDVEALEKSWQEKLSKREKELQDALGQRESWLDEMTIDMAAAKLAADLDYEGSSKLLLPLIKPRLKRDVRDGKPAVTVLDATGKPSASTLEDLKNEFLSDATLAKFVKGSSATGGGAGGSKGGSAAVKTMTRSAFETLNDTDRMTYIQGGGSITN